MFCIGVVSDSISEQLVFKYSVSLYVWTRRIFQIHTIFIYAHAVEWVHSKKSSAYSGHSREKKQGRHWWDLFPNPFYKKQVQDCFRKWMGIPPPPKKEKENLSYLSKTMSNHIQELQQHGSVVKRSECCAVTCCYPLKTFCVIWNIKYEWGKH